MRLSRCFIDCGTDVDIIYLELNKVYNSVPHPMKYRLATYRVSVMAQQLRQRAFQLESQLPSQDPNIL